MTMQTFESFVLFEKVLGDELGTLYRAGEIGREGLQRRTWLRVLDGDGLPASELIAGLEEANLIGSSVQATNLVANPRFLEHDGVPAMAWDYVPGQTLQAIFERTQTSRTPLSTGAALLLIKKLARAVITGLMVQVGGKDLVHGFLHPAMVSVTNDGQVLVSGYGIAARLTGLLDSPAAAEPLLPYLAPEVIASRTIGKRADVYSLGAILFQLLTNEALPAQPTARLAALDRVLVLENRQPLPEGIKAVLATALATDPGERYRSAAELVEALRQLEGEGGTGQTASTFDIAVMMYHLFPAEIDAEERKRIADAAVDLTPFLVLEPEPEAGSIVASPAAGSSKRGLWIGLAAFVAVALIAAAVLIRPMLTPPAPAPAPTPTQEELAAQEQAKSERLAALVEAEVARLMAEKEEEIRQELDERQERIEGLRQQLNDVTAKRSETSTGPTAEERRQAEQLRREIEQAEEERQRRMAELAEQRRKVEEEARKAQEAALAEARSRQPAAGSAEQPPAQVSTPVPIAAPTAVPAVVPTVVPTVVVPPKAVPTTAPAEVATDAVVTEPVKLSGPGPVYPKLALRAEVSGSVTLTLHISEKGRVKDVTVVKGRPKGLTEAAIDAVKQWRFKPATLNGTPIESTMNVVIRFDLPK